MQNSAEFPNGSVFRSLVDRSSPYIYLLLNLPQIAGASLRALPPLPMMLARLCNPVVLFLFAGGLFIPRNPGARQLSRWVLQLGAWAILLFSLLSRDTTHFLALVPAVGVVAAGTLLQICRKRENNGPERQYWSKGKTRRIFWCLRMLSTYRFVLLGGFLLLLTAFPMLGARLNRPKKTPPRLPPGLEMLQQQTNPDELIMTDAPWAVAWWGKRRGVWLPQDQKSMDNWLEQKDLTPDWIYLRGFPGIQQQEFARWWLELIRQPNESWMQYSPNMAEGEQALIRRKLPPLGTPSPSSALQGSGTVEF